MMARWDSDGSGDTHLLRAAHAQEYLAGEDQHRPLVAEIKAPTAAAIEGMPAEGVAIAVSDAPLPGAVPRIASVDQILHERGRKAMAPARGFIPEHNRAR
jgi:hypothetical protein